MNKIIKGIAISTITAALAVSSFGCSLKNNSNDKNDSETSSVSAKKFEDIKIELSESQEAPLNETNINVLDNNTDDLDKLKEAASGEELLIDMTTQVYGSEMSTLLAKKGNNSFMKLDMYGFKEAVLIKGNDTYMLNEENKIYCKNSSSESEEEPFDNDELKNIFDGKLLGVYDVEIDGGTFRRLKLQSAEGSDLVREAIISTPTVKSGNKPCSMNIK